MAFDTAFTETYDISGNWLSPSLAQQGFRALNGLINVQLYAGGGFGGSNSLAQGGGGGGGAFSQVNDIQIQEGQLYQIILGAGRPAAFANVMTADHGKNGTDAGGFLGLQAGDPGAGGTAGNSTGQIRFSGANGQTNQGGGGAGDQGNGQGTQGGPRDGGNGNAQNTQGEALNGGLNSNGTNPGLIRGRININYRREWLIGLRQIRQIQEFLANRGVLRISSGQAKNISENIFRGLIRITRETSNNSDVQNVRELERKVINDRNFIDVVQRDLDRFFRSFSESQDVIQRVLRRTIDESLLLEDNVLREITYVSTDEKFLIGTFSRTVSRLKQNDLNIQDVSQREINRTNTEEKLIQEIFEREINRIFNDERLFDDISTREINRVLQESKLYEDEDVKRVITKTRDQLNNIISTFSREINRTNDNFTLLDDSYKAEKKTADFDGYNQDVELLLQHSNEWMKEHYGPYIQQILRRIVSDTRESDDFE